ncbi:UNVERIFIED_CONTAM: hypothetical protein FKN15_037156 [Acipenser sinensis]
MAGLVATPGKAEPAVTPGDGSSGGPSGGDGSSGGPSGGDLGRGAPGQGGGSGSSTSPSYPVTGGSTCEAEQQAALGDAEQQAALGDAEQQAAPGDVEQQAAPGDPDGHRQFESSLFLCRPRTGAPRGRRSIGRASPRGGRARSARVPSALCTPATPVVWPGASGFACKLPRVALSSNITMGDCMLVAVVTDRLTDGDVFHDLVAVARRGMAVYILLEQRGEESFQEMREREGERGGGGEENMRVRVVGGVSFCSHDGKMVSGEMKEKFILIDHETVITGSYR